ncbi:HK97-gp10 family putative phage morphogenesis protein [Clostridium sp. UBA1652]|uniref:HK97-gp10 family putative phage morphogenesis protein n=1 Tax=Clostridium sp. UBA1652 TaxID=1946348 RepID=UPI00257A3B66|nr:HK97-gp10 family putative phage morphogenesis protein [Clostridium sp. UBA1652]
MSSVVGLESLLKKLNALGGNVEETLYKSIQNQGQLVKDDAQDLVPVDTGDLKKSIHRETKKLKGKIVSIIYTNSDHAAYVEFGTGKVGEETNQNTNVSVSYKQDKWLVNIPDVGPRWIKGQPAQPYLYPALKNNEDRIIKNIRQDIKEAIRKAAKR